MSDIELHGLGALIIFLGLACLFASMLLIALIFFFIEKRKKRNTSERIKATGFILSSICGLILSILIILTLDRPYDRDYFELLDKLSFFIAPVMLALAVWFGVWYRKVVSRL